MGWKLDDGAQREDHNAPTACAVDMDDRENQERLAGG